VPEISLGLVSFIPGKLVLEAILGELLSNDFQLLIEVESSTSCHQPAI
jgi:hypothetical protein